MWCIDAPHVNKRINMNTYAEGRLEDKGFTIRYAESGTGQPVIVFPAGDGLRFDDIAATLAAHYRVIVLDVPDSGLGNRQDVAEHIGQALTRIGVESFSVIGMSHGTTRALAQATSTPEHVHRLVLVSPLLASGQQPQLEARLSDVKAPTLVLVGTRDRSGSREAGHLCRSRIPTCHLLLVYDTGQAIASDRREACLSPIVEFLEQGEGFIVSRESQLIRP